MLPELSTIEDMILAGDWLTIAVALAMTLGVFGLHQISASLPRRIRGKTATRESSSRTFRKGSIALRSMVECSLQIRRWPALNGCDSPADLLAIVSDIGGQWYVDPNRRSQFRRVLMRDGQIQDFVSEVFRYKTRERIWVVESARLVRDPTNEPPALL